MRFLSSAGREILVGRGNVQNDELTFRVARRTDLWLHVQKVPGSHVIVSQAEGPADRETVLEAASLAVTYSQARDGGKAAVDYTQVRNVKKPAGARPGRVIYTDYATVIAQGDETLGPAFEPGVTLERKERGYMDRLDLLREEMRALEQGRRYAVVTIAGTEGATSRNSGKMLVFEDGPPVGTVGGGDMEQQAIRDARESLTRGKGGLFTYAVLAGSDGMTCGGKVSVLVEVPEARPLLVLCGGGHVGGAVLKLAAFLGFETILIDDRDETVMGEKIALAGRFIRVKDYRKDLRTLEIPERAYVVLATHSHSTDAVALEAMLDKNTAYLGMLASRRKSRPFLRRWSARAFRRSACGG